METFYAFWHAHLLEIVLALVFAAIFAVVVDFFQPASNLRAAVRHIKNKLAEQSVALLRQRIKDSEAYRNRVATFMESDKALYMATLQYIVGMLFCMCLAALFLMMERISSLALGPGYPERYGPAFIGAFLMIILAIILGVYGTKTAFWDTRAKVAEAVAKLDAEIAEMKIKLAAKTK